MTIVEEIIEAWKAQRADHFLSLEQLATIAYEVITRGDGEDADCVSDAALGKARGGGELAIATAAQRGET